MGITEFVYNFNHLYEAKVVSDLLKCYIIDVKVKYLTKHNLIFYRDLNN